MNTKSLVLVICVEAIVYLLLYNLLVCAFNKITTTTTTTVRLMSVFPCLLGLD